MKVTIFALFALGIGQMALAQGLPVPSYNGRCPYHTYKQAGSCVPFGDHQVYWNGFNNRGCPLSWTRDGEYCVK